MTGKDNALVTVNWDQPPVSNPESSLTGGMYQDVDGDADIVVHDPTSWALAGTGLAAGQHLPNAMRGEFDRYVPGGVAPANVDIITHSVIPNRHGNYSDMTWFTAPGGGGVLDTGNASWVGQLADAPLIPPNVLQGPGARGDRPPAADHAERLLGARAPHRPASPTRRRATGGRPTRRRTTGAAARSGPGHAAARDAACDPGRQ